MGTLKYVERISSPALVEVFAPVNGEYEFVGELYAPHTAQDFWISSSKLDSFIGTEKYTYTIKGCRLDQAKEILNKKFRELQDR